MITYLAFIEKIKWGMERVEAARADIAATGAEIEEEIAFALESEGMYHPVSAVGTLDSGSGRTAPVLYVNEAVNGTSDVATVLEALEELENEVSLNAPVFFAGIRPGSEEKARTLIEDPATKVHLFYPRKLLGEYLATAVNMYVPCVVVKQQTPEEIGQEAEASEIVLDELEWFREARDFFNLANV